MRICVLGGSGTVGSLLVEEGRRRGHDVVAVSRRSGADAVSGAGLVDAFRGADAVVDALNIPTASAGTSIAFFSATASHVARAVAEVGVSRLVVLSIAGVERPELQRGNGYYRGKAVQETMYRSSDAPVTIVKTTQWFELASTFLLGRVGRLSFVPHMLAQPIAAATVADRVMDLLEASGAGGEAPVLAGPEVRDLADLARAIGASRTPRQRVLAFHIPGAGKRFAAGALLPGPDREIAGPRFEEWLTAAPR